MGLDRLRKRNVCPCTHVLYKVHKAYGLGRAPCIPQASTFPSHCWILRPKSTGLEAHLSRNYVRKSYSDPLAYLPHTCDLKALRVPTALLPNMDVITSPICKHSPSTPNVICVPHQFYGFSITLFRPEAVVGGWG